MILRNVIYSLILFTSFNSISQGQKVEGKFCKFCVGSRIFVDYVSPYQFDAGIDVLIMTTHGNKSSGMRKIGRPKTANNIFLRLGFEHNFKYPIPAFKGGIAYQPFKFPYYDAPFLLKALGTLNFEINFLPYKKGEFKSFVFRPEAGFIIPFFVRLVPGYGVVRVLQFKINYGYNLYKNNVVLSFMSQHCITAGLVWKTDRTSY